MKIEILGPGCARCASLCEVVRKIVAESGLDATLVEVEDIVKIMGYGVLRTPALVVDGVVRIRGRVPSESEIRRVLGL